MAGKSAAEHLHEFHKASYEYHTRMVEAHRAQMTKAKGNESDQAAQSARAFHQSAISAHLAMEVFHSSAAAQTQKAIGDELHKSNDLAYG